MKTIYVAASCVHVQAKNDEYKNACYDCGWSPLGLISVSGTFTTPSSITGGPSASRGWRGVGIAMRTATVTAGGADANGDEDTGVQGTIGDDIPGAFEFEALAGENGVRKGKGNRNGRRKRIVRDDDASVVAIWGDGLRAIGADLICAA
jgi:hypothetical protein